MTVHTPSIAFRHLSPNSARIGYANEGVQFRITCESSESARREWKIALYKSDQQQFQSSGFQARSKDQEILEEGGGAGPSS